MKWILLSSGNIPVDRKSKDRQILFSGTFDALAKGECVALFPEGTSYTEPRIMQVKDGAAWAAMEYTKWARENPDKASPLPITICPAAIVYTDKSKYRSNVSSLYIIEGLCLANYSAGYYGVGTPGLRIRMTLTEMPVDLETLSLWSHTWRNSSQPQRVLNALQSSDSLARLKVN